MVVDLCHFPVTVYASQHIWCLSQARINWEGCVRKGILHKNRGDGRNGAPISLDGVAVHPHCWCICLCYLHFAPEIKKTLFSLIRAIHGVDFWHRASLDLSYTVFKEN